MGNQERAWERLRGWGEEPGSAAILTDIDGTLAPIVPTPDMSEVPEEIRELLRRLNGEYLLVAGVTGRKTEDARDLVGLDGIVYSGNHGFEIMRDGVVEVVPEAAPYRSAVEELEGERGRSWPLWAPSSRISASRPPFITATSRRRWESGAWSSSGAREDGWA